VPNWVYAIDSNYYAINPVYNDYLKAQLAKLTLEDVNRVIKRYIRSDRGHDCCSPQRTAKRFEAANWRADDPLADDLQFPENPRKSPRKTRSWSAGP